MSELAAIATALVTFLIAAGSPGPATLGVAHTALALGRGAALMFGLGLSAGLAFWGVIAGLGVGALLLSFAPALVALKIAGGLYLLWLAWLSGREALSEQGRPLVADGDAGSARAMFIRGLLLNLSNPKAIFAWLAVIGLGLPGEASHLLVATVVLLCASLGVGIYSAYAVLFSRPGAMRVYGRFSRSIGLVFAGLFAAVGLKTLTSRIAGS